MATAKQTCEIIDAVLRLPENTSRWHADRLRSAGLLPATQGRPEEIDSSQTATLLLGVLVGTSDIRSYLEMLPLTGGAQFGSAIADFITAPNDILELRIDAVAPGATLTFRGRDNGVRTATYASNETHVRPAFEREICVGPEVFIRLAAAIRNAPPVRVGRRRHVDRYVQYETTRKY